MGEPDYTVILSKIENDLTSSLTPGDSVATSLTKVQNYLHDVFYDGNYPIAAILRLQTTEFQNEYTYWHDWHAQAWQRYEPGIKAWASLGLKLDRLTSQDGADLMDAFWQSFFKSGKPLLKKMLTTHDPFSAATQSDSSALPAGFGAGATTGVASRIGVDVNDTGGAFADEDNVEGLQDVVSDAISEATVWLISNGVAPLIKQAVTQVAPPVLKIAEAGASALTAPFVNAFQPGMTAIVKKITTGPALTEEQVWPAVMSLYTDAAKYGVEAHLLSSLADIEIAGCKFNFGPVTAFLADVADYGRLIDPMIDEAVAAKLGAPAHRAAMRAFRPARPDIDTLNDLYVRGLITESTWNDELQAKGFPETWIKTLSTGLHHAADVETIHEQYRRQLITRDQWQTALEHKGLSDEAIDSLEPVIFKRFNARQARMLLQSPAVDTDYLYKALQDSGLSDGDAAVMLDATTANAYKPYTDKLLTESLAQRKKGHLSHGSFMVKAQQLGYSGDVLSILQDAAIAQRQGQMKGDALTLAEDLFEKAFISIDGFDTFVAACEVDDFEAKKLHMLAVVKKYNRVTWKREADQQAAFDKQVKSSVPKYLTAYKLGDMTTGDLETVLETAGLLPEVADVTVLLAKNARNAKVAASLKALGVPDKRDFYISGLLSAADYRKDLIMSGAAPAVVDAEIAYATQKRNERIGAAAKSQGLYTYESAYKKGLIDVDTLTSLYDAAGIVAPIQTVRLALLDSRASSAASGLKGSADIMTEVQAVAAGVVTPEDFTNEMQDFGVTVGTSAAALALVPVFQKQQQAQNPTLDYTDLAALKKAMDVRLISNNYVRTDWLATQLQRRSFAVINRNNEKPRGGVTPSGSLGGTSLV